MKWKEGMNGKKGKMDRWKGELKYEQKEREDWIGEWEN